MKIFIEKENRHAVIKFNGSASKLLEKLSINPEAVLVVRNNNLITEDEKVGNDDEVKILSVISGG